MRGSHFTIEHQRYARSCVKRESLVRAGKRGAAVTRAKLGEDTWFNYWRRWKLDHPSQPERLIIGLLARLGFTAEDYLREHRLAPSLLSLDFYFDDLNKAVEVHSRIHSTLTVEKRKACDKRKRAICQQRGIETLWLRQTDLNNVPKLFQKLQRFLRPQ